MSFFNTRMRRTVNSTEKSVVELGKEYILKMILFLLSDIVIMSLIFQNTKGQEILVCIK